MIQTPLRGKTKVVVFFFLIYENWLVKGKRTVMPLLKVGRPHLSLHPLYQRLVRGPCNGDQHYQMQPDTVIIKEVLEMPTLALSLLLFYKPEIKDLFRNKTILYGGETQIFYNICQLHMLLSSNKYSCVHAGESNVTTRESAKPFLLDWKV